MTPYAQQSSVADRLCKTFHSGLDFKVNPQQGREISRAWADFSVGGFRMHCCVNSMAMHCNFVQQNMVW